MKLVAQIEKIDKEERGHFAEGKVESWHSFSFAPYINLGRLNFGALFALNQYVIKSKGKLFPTQCKNREVLIIPLQGTLGYRIKGEKKESLRKGECLRLSAGLGIEYLLSNPSLEEAVEFIELWIHPEERDLSPSKEKKQISLFAQPQISSLDCSSSPIAVKEESEDLLSSGVVLIASKFATPMSSSETLFLPQDVLVYGGRLLPGQTHLFPLRFRRGGIFLSVLKGTLYLKQGEVKKEELTQGESLLLKEIESVDIEALSLVEFLLIQVSLLTL